MKCRDIDVIGYLNGNAPEEARSHIEGCKSCSDELEKLKRIHLLISTYAAGKKLEKELDERLASIDMTNMKELPEEVGKKVAALRGKNLTDRLKKVVGERGKNVKDFVDNIMNPQMHAMPASPKDITKTKLKKKKGKNNA